MKVSIVIGGQYGSEGKGKVTSLLALDYGKEVVVVRCGGPNSGHTIIENNTEYKLRMLPSGIVYGNRGYIAPAAVIDLNILKNEILTVLQVI